jgi:hypothetical protein
MSKFNKINNFPVVTLLANSVRAHNSGGKGGARVVLCCVRDNISKELAQVHTLEHLYMKHWEG